MADFDPRLAALAHAGLAGDFARSEVNWPSGIGEAANAIVCGLVYVGDQIARLAEQREPVKAAEPTPEEFVTHEEAVRRATVVLEDWLGGLDAERAAKDVVAAMFPLSGLRIRPQDEGGSGV